MYGISQNPNTKDYIIVCQDVLLYYSGNKQIDDIIQEIQLKISPQNDLVFEWIPYNQFDDIKEINKGDFATVYSAKWKGGPLYCKWCQSCQINYLKENFIKWTSGNKEIDDVIQEIQLGIYDFNDIVFEWIPYNQFDDIKEISKGSFATVYSAIWKDGPLKYDKDNAEYTRKSDKNVVLKYLHNSQKITNEFLNEV